MSYSVNWTTRVVTIPLADMTLISGTNYSLNTDDVWLEMRRLEALPTEGLWVEQSIEYVNTQILSGITYSAIVKMINGFTWDTDTTNKTISLLGFNSNLLDTFIPGSGVSVLANNSGGLIINQGQSLGQVDLDNIADAVWNMVIVTWKATTIGGWITKKLLTVSKFIGLK
jgi:hypothetical protein